MTVNEVDPPVFKFNADHMNPVYLDQLTGLAITNNNDRFVTSDTSGRIKMFNLSNVDFKGDISLEEKEK